MEEIIKNLNLEEQREFLQLLEEYERQGKLKGGSLWDWIRDTGSVIGHKVMDILGVGKKYVRNTRLALEEYGGALVNNIFLCRTPVQAFVSSALNLVSQGKFKEEAKKLGYDDMFHVYALLFLNNGKVLVIEKNQTINVALADESYYDPAKTYEIKVEKIMSINDIMSNTQKYMGDKFFEYDGKNNNCQVFLISMLRANGITSTGAEAFLKQDTEQIFNNIDNTVRDIARTTTDIGAMYDHFKSWLMGGKIK